MADSIIVIMTAAIVAIIEFTVMLSIALITVTATITTTTLAATLLLRDRFADYVSNSCGRNQHTIASN